MYSVELCVGHLVKQLNAVNAFRLVTASPPKSPDYSRVSALNTTLNQTTLNSLQFHVLALRGRGVESFCLSFVSENVCVGYTQIGVFRSGIWTCIHIGTNLWPCSNAKATTTIVHQPVVGYKTYCGSKSLELVKTGEM